MMTNPMKDIAAHSLKKSGSLSSLSSHEFRRKGIHGRIKDSVSTVSYMDEPSQREEVSRLTVQMENTYQLGPTKHFPVVTVNHILKDVLTNYLQEENYEPELCRQMAKTIAEVIKARVKELMIPRYKLVVIIHIGQLDVNNWALVGWKLPQAAEDWAKHQPELSSNIKRGKKPVKPVYGDPGFAFVDKKGKDGASHRQ